MILLLIVAATFAVTDGPESYAAGPSVVRISGTDRYATAASISQAAFPSGAPVAFIATGQTFPDALAGSAAAARAHAPVLLVEHDAVPPATAAEIDRLRPARIVVLGGVDAISDSVSSQLEASTGAAVSRVAGADRYATAAALSAATFDTGTAVVYVADGDGFADAMVAGAAAGAAGGPVLLVTPAVVPADTVAELRRLAPASVVVVGGPASVSTGVETRLRELTTGPVGRSGGPDRYATSAAVAANAFQPGVPEVLVATGANFPDALAAGSPGALAPGPVLLTRAACIPDTVNEQIDRLQPARMVVLGGLAAVGAGVEARRVCATGAADPGMAAPCGLTPAPPARYDHVVIVMFENKTYPSVIGSPDAPYATEMARLCASSPSWSDAGSRFPSLPSYLALTSGQTPVDNDCSPGAGCETTIDNVFRQVRAAGGTATSYQESMRANCELGNDGSYAVRHNPAAYYVGGDDRAACAVDDVPYTQLDPDHLPTLAFVTPNVVDDTHDGSVALGDRWASTNVQAILDGADYVAGRTAVLWVWDEDTPLPNVVIAPSVRPGTTVPAASHYGALRAVEEMLGLPLLGRAADAASIKGPFNL